MPKPRVLYFLNSFNRGGAEQGLIKLVEDGAFAGCDLKVRSMVKGSGEPLDSLRALGVDAQTFSQKGGMGAKDLASSFMKLRALLSEFKPHVLVLSLPQANIIGRLAAMFSPVIVASFEHNTRLAKKPYETAFRLTSSLVDWLIADCVPTADEVSASFYKPPPRRRFILPLASLPGGRVELAKAASSSGRLVIGNAGRFTSVKNQAAMIEAVRLLADRGVDVELRLYGEGPEEASYRALAEQLGVADRVVMPGFVPAWWEDAPLDIFLLASRHEGLCIVAIEAMRNGVPVVAPPVGGLAQYGGAGITQVLDSIEPDAIADAILALANDPERRAALGSAGYKSVMKHFSDRAVKEQYQLFNAALHQMGLKA